MAPRSPSNFAPFVTHVLLVSAFCVAGTPTGAHATPEAPVIDRDVANVIGGRFTRPHMPPLRTSADGRVGVNLKNGGGQVTFFLIAPERIDTAFVDSPPGAGILSSTRPYSLPPSLFHRASGFSVHHRTLCDPATEFPEPGRRNNPYPCGSNDCYDLTVIMGGVVQVDGTDHVQLWGTPITVSVRDPKTPHAEIDTIIVGTPVGGAPFPANAFFEPMTTYDGHLIVARIGTPNHFWENPETGEQLVQFTDLVYAVQPEDCCPCDVTGWIDFHPITHAPHDPALNDRYGFAMQPFRDPFGQVIPDGWDLRVTYPWIDRYGRNLFFTTVGEMLGNRYEADCVPGEDCGPTGDDSGKTRGHAVMGLWTHGKMVLLDNELNNIDYGFDIQDSAHRMLHLYEPGTGPGGTGDGRVRIGTGRDNVESHGHPPGAVFNTTILDSPENLFNFHLPTRPVTPRDVVWLVNNGKASAEVPFDDYLNPNGFIVSNMAGALEFELDRFDAGRLLYHNGWNAPLLLQNAATALDTAWQVPPAGAVIGNGRLEPVANGGIHGRGLWLDGRTRVEYEIFPQPRDVSAYDWYAGVFLDCRFPDDDVDRTLFSYPDGSAVVLDGRHRVRYRAADGRTVGSVTFAAPLPREAWSHLGFQILDGGKRVRAYVDGFLTHEWSGVESILQLSPGVLRLGGEDNGGGGIVGWIDDFKVFAQDVGAEVACNHAGGTLIGFDSDDVGPWMEIAARYPDWSHAEIATELLHGGEQAYDWFACYRDSVSDHGAHLGNIPSETESVRGGLLFPEGPLVYDAPRPDVTLNPFCNSCHHVDGKRGLDLAALPADPSTPARDDHRRQPLQPFRVVTGNVPADWIAPGVPPQPVTLPDEGFVIDEWVQESLAERNPDVVGISLIDADRDRPIAVLMPGDTIDLASLPTESLNLRANTSGPLAGVTFVLDEDTLSDSIPPFSAFGDDGGDYTAGTLGVGDHTLWVHPEPAGPPGLRLDFTVVERGTAIVGNYRDAFLSPAPAPGWSYLWNRIGGIGNESAYEALSWDRVDRYDADGIAGLPDGPGAGWVNLHALGGTPGYGTGEGETDDRYAIVGYEVTVPGVYAIVRSQLQSVFSHSGNGGEVRVYVGDRLSHGVIWRRGEEVSFDGTVGWVERGERIYVAVGPRGDSKSDGFEMDFTIARRHAAEVVADYQRDFQGGEPAPGWRYLWNQRGEMGRFANYVPLQWDGVERYDSDGVPGLPDSTDMGYGSLHADGGRTGYGVNQGSGFDHFAIAAFTAPRSGRYVIGKGAVTGLWDRSTGYEVRIEAGERLVRRSVHAGGTKATLGADLGWVFGGTPIAVAIGPDGDSGSDVYGLDFRIERVPLDAEVRTSRVDYAPGDTLDVTLTLRNPGLPDVVDWYFGFIWPDGETITYLDESRTAREGSRSDLTSLQPLWPGADLLEPSQLTLPSFYQSVFDGSEPRGVYTAFIAAVKSGGLDDGRLNEWEWVAFETSRYRLLP